MTAKEFRRWVAYADMGDPWLDLQTEEKQDLRTGVIGATLANLLGSGRKKYQPSDFSPRWNTGETKPKQTPEEMKRAGMKIAAAFKKRKQS